MLGGPLEPDSPDGLAFHLAWLHRRPGPLGESVNLTHPMLHAFITSACMLAKWTCESCTCTATKHTYRNYRISGLGDAQLQVYITLQESMTISMA